MGPTAGERLRELWQYRELLYFMVWRDIKVRYKQTLLGVAWALIQPVFTTVVFFLFFGKMAKMPSDGIPYPVFSYLGLAAWTYFAGAVSYASNSMVANARLLTKVYFPRILIPAAGVLSTLPDFAISSLLGLVVLKIYGIPIGWGFLLWPVLALPLVLLALGASLFLATLNVRFRDVKYAIPFLIQLWLFLTPIIYPTSIVPERFRHLTFINPLTGLINAFRAVVLPDIAVAWPALLTGLALTLLLLIGGVTMFHRFERSFADII